MKRPAEDTGGTLDDPEGGLVVRDEGVIGGGGHRLLSGDSPTASKILAEQIKTCDHSTVDYRPFEQNGEFRGWLVRGTQESMAEVCRTLSAAGLALDTSMTTSEVDQR